MKKFVKILGVLSIAFGVIWVLVGGSDNGIESEGLTVVIAGACFMALGVSIFALNKKE